MIDSFQAPKSKPRYREVASESHSQRSPTCNLINEIKEENEAKETLLIASMIGQTNQNAGSLDQEFDISSAYYAQSADVSHLNSFKFNYGSVNQNQSLNVEQQKHQPIVPPKLPKAIRPLTASVRQIRQNSNKVNLTTNEQPRRVVTTQL